MRSSRPLRAATPLLALAALLLGATTVGAEGPLRFPFVPIDGWYVQQGYDRGTHDGYERYALDLARRDGGAGSAIVAPASGTVAWVDETYGCVSVALGRDDLHLSTCHVEPLAGIARGQAIAAGAPLGAVAAPGARGNGNMAHVHIALYRDPSGGRDRSQRVAVPFDGANALSGIAFPAGQEHTGKDVAKLTPGPLPPSANPFPPQELRAGANAIAYLGPALPPAQAFASLGQTYRALYGWDAEARRWRIHLPGALESSDLALVRPFTAYWLISDGAATYLPPATSIAAPAETPLSAGGNFIVYPGADTPVAALAARLDGALLAIYGWDAENGRWRVYFPAVDPALATLRRWGVYWLILTRDATLPTP